MVETEVKTNPAINKAHGMDILYQMMRIRRFEEKSAEMYTKMKIRGFMHLYNGEEAVTVGIIPLLKATDNVVCTYREHGQALIRGIDAGVIMAEMYGKLEGCCRGRGGSMHLFDVKRKFFGGNAIVAGHLPMSVGLALADKKQGRKQITCCFFGDGAVAEGEFHEAMNLAALWQVPILFVCENNMYAMGTAIKYTHSMLDLEKKGAAYGITSTCVDGMDVIAVGQAAQKAIDTINRTGGPYFLVCNTYRFRAHSMFDSEMYREKSEVEEWKKKDPIVNLGNSMINAGLIAKDDIKQLEDKIELEVQRAVDFAENGKPEPVSELTRFVYSEPVIKK